MIKKASLLIFVFIQACTQAQNDKKTLSNLSAREFYAQIGNSSKKTILDVRTPGEYESGHIAKALNIDWNGTDFEEKLSVIDKSLPVYVYCLSGGRSSSAARKMRSLGFTTVELDGGMMAWRANELPETTAKNTSNEKKQLTQADFSNYLNSNKIVLIDFYADWCIPCKKMKPYLEEIADEMKTSVDVIRIDADINKDLCKAMGIDALPVLQVYKNKKLTWNQKGFVEKSEVVKNLK
jgi:thioredoxin